MLPQTVKKFESYHDRVSCIIKDLLREDNMTPIDTLSIMRGLSMTITLCQSRYAREYEKKSREFDDEAEVAFFENYQAQFFELVERVQLDDRAPAEVKGKTVAGIIEGLMRNFCQQDPDCFQEVLARIGDEGL